MSNDTICAISTAKGKAAIALVRLSGKNAIELLHNIFHSKSITLASDFEANKTYYGYVKDQDNDVDQVVVAIFKSPHSYTGEDLVEINCHGSEYIQQKIMELLIRKGARLAKPGEFTMKAFLNGKMDLSQAEAVADLINAHSQSAHQLALNQMRGGFSKKIKELRSQLLVFASMVELELDFSQEDIEFADKTKLLQLVDNIDKEVVLLLNSFSKGNVIKNGIPVAIVGKPNVGKSTLLNSLLNDERAIVSDIPGTTRDTIEDMMVIDGIQFRFIDTAGLRKAESDIENYGIERTYNTIQKAKIILYLFDITTTGIEEIKEVIEDFWQHIDDDNKLFIFVANKTDMLGETPHDFRDFVEMETIFISAKRKENIELITERLVKAVGIKKINDETLVSNIRHYEALEKSDKALKNVKQALIDEVPGDLLAIDLKQVLYHLGEISGEISNDEVLNNIFVNFCIGK